MKRFFRRNGGDPTAGRHSSLDTRDKRRGAYTAEVPEVGTGHYIFDRSDSCSIHSRRLEAWCDVQDFDVARDELHWHCMMLSQFGIPPEEVRQMAKQLIESRQRKLAADRELVFEAELAGVEGTVNSAPARVDGEREERQQAERRENELREEAREKSDAVESIRKRFEALPRRHRVPIGRTLVFSVSISFTIFDVGVLGNAFELLAGDWYWKIILTAGVALAPLSTAIGIAQWLSAAELPIREGVKATRLAMFAGFLCIVGIGLIVLFRAAATGDPPLPWSAYVFLAFIQSALALAETMLYTVYFDGKVGAALLKRIEAGEKQVATIDARAVTEHQRAVSTQSRIGEIEQGAKEAESKLGMKEPELQRIRTSFDGEAGMLTGIVEAAIMEGMVASERSEYRRIREAKEPVEDQPSWVGAVLAVAGAGGFVLLLMLMTGSVSL